MKKTNFRNKIFYFQHKLKSRTLAELHSRKKCMQCCLFKSEIFFIIFIHEFFKFPICLSFFELCYIIFILYAITKCILARVIAIVFLFTPASVENAFGWKVFVIQLGKVHFENRNGGF